MTFSMVLRSLRQPTLIFLPFYYTCAAGIVCLTSGAVFCMDSEPALLEAARFELDRRELILELGIRLVNSTCLLDYIWKRLLIVSYTCFACGTYFKSDDAASSGDMLLISCVSIV